MADKRSYMDTHPFDTGAMGEDQLAQWAEMLKQIFEPMFGRVIDMSQFGKGAAGMSIANPVNQANVMYRQLDNAQVDKGVRQVGERLSNALSPYKGRDSVFGALINFATQSTEDLIDIKRNFEGSLRTVGVLWDPALAEKITAREGASPEEVKTADDAEAARLARETRMSTRSQNAADMFSDLMEKHSLANAAYSKTDLAAVTSQLMRSNRGEVTQALDTGQTDRIKTQARGLSSALNTWSEILGTDVKTTMAQLSDMFGSDVVAMFKDNSDGLKSMALNMKQAAAITGSTMGEVYRTAQMAQPAVEKFLGQGPQGKQGAFTVGMMSHLASMPKDMYGIDPEQFKRETVVENAAAMGSGMAKTVSGMYSAWAETEEGRKYADESSRREAFKRRVSGAMKKTGAGAVSDEVLKEVGLGGYNRNDLVNLAANRNATEFRTQDSFATNIAGLKGGENMERQLGAMTSVLAEDSGMKISGEDARALVMMKQPDRAVKLREMAKAQGLSEETATKVGGRISSYYQMKLGNEDQWRAKAEQRKEGMEREQMATERAQLEKNLGVNENGLYGVRGAVFAMGALTNKEMRKQLTGKDGAEVKVEDVMVSVLGLSKDDKKRFLEADAAKKMEGYDMSKAHQEAFKGRKWSKERSAEEMKMVLGNAYDDMNKAATADERKRIQAELSTAQTGIKTSVDEKGNLVFGGKATEEERKKAFENLRERTVTGKREKLSEDLKVGKGGKISQTTFDELSRSTEGMRKLELYKRMEEMQTEKDESGNAAYSPERLAEIKKMQKGLLGDGKKAPTSSADAARALQEITGKDESAAVNKKLREEYKMNTESNPAQEILEMLTKLVSGDGIQVNVKGGGWF